MAISSKAWSCLSGTFYNPFALYLLLYFFQILSCWANSLYLFMPFLVLSFDFRDFFWHLIQLYFHFTILLNIIWDLFMICCLSTQRRLWCNLKVWFRRSRSYSNWFILTQFQVIHKFFDKFLSSLILFHLNLIQLSKAIALILHFFIILDCYLRSILYLRPSFTIFRF